MKRYILLPALTLIVAACSDRPAAEAEGAIERVPETVTIRAHSERLWSNKDVISVFDTDFNKVNLTTSQDNVPSATFSTKAWTGRLPVYAAFCSRKNETTCTPEGVMGVFIKSAQSTDKKNYCSKDGEAAVGKITGSTGSYEVSMKNVSAFVKVNLKTGIVGKISVSSNAGETMTGYVDVDYAKIIAGQEDCWTPTYGKSVSTSASLVPATTACFEKGEYLISILPGVYSKGISFTAYDDEGKVLVKGAISEEQSLKVNRNDFLGVTVEIDTSFEFNGVSSENVPTGDTVYFD